MLRRIGLLTLGLVLIVLVWLVWRWRSPLESACAGSATPTFATLRPLPKTLRGARVMLNPGHGLTRSDDGAWEFQRPQPDGRTVFALEDDSNVRIARTIKRVLESSGAVVLTTRELGADKLGVSGQPAWRESARHHLAALNVNAGIWDSSGLSLRGDCAQAQDIRARALYANQVQADVLLSLHSNAGRAAARGSLVLYAKRSFLPSASDDLPAQSACLAKRLAGAIPKAVRLERPDLNWPDASFAGSSSYGETGYALMPSVILETAFHTNAIDGKALGQESFRAAIADGVRDALIQFLESKPLESPRSCV